MNPDTGHIYAFDNDEERKRHVRRGRPIGRQNRPFPMKKTRHIEIRPCTVKRAQRWVAETHRRLKKIQGGMWALRALYDGEMVGVAIVGNPARLLAEEGVLCVLRVAVREGYRNVCSALYGACARAARAMGATSLVTYTHEDEPGTTLRAAGWIDGGLTDGGEWGRPSRPREPALWPEPKRRWWAPWSARIERSQ